MAKSKAKILVVDDNSGIRAALKVLLPLHFSQVELIPSPKELVSRLADFRPDVVLLDMNFHTDINMSQNTVDAFFQVIFHIINRNNNRDCNIIF